MKLLLVTQKVDAADPVLGFFVRWIEELAKHFEKITVIALGVGEYSLPKNVTVHTLGKEVGLEQFPRRLRFIALLFRLQDQYDRVFVHMNPEYIVLAGWWWKLTGKKIGLWYNHTVGSIWLKIAEPLCDFVFHTSPFAYTARYKKAIRMPAGIDTNVFKPQPSVQKIPKSIYFQGRIAPAKRVHVILEAFRILRNEGVAGLLTLVGPEDPGYGKELRSKYAREINEGSVVFKGGVKNSDTPALYAAHTVSVNLTDSGNYDKSVLESLACGTPVITSSGAFSDAPVVRIHKPDARELAAAYQKLSLKPETLPLVRYVGENHALPMLAKRISSVFSGEKTAGK